MEVLVKDMEMPTSCGKCKLFDASHAIGLFAPIGWCRVNGEEIYRLSVKADFCPLVPVPPHGRCIDADALEYEEAYLNGHYELGDVELVTRKDIESAPTIIPASQEGET